MFYLLHQLSTSLAIMIFMVGLVCGQETSRPRISAYLDQLSQSRSAVKTFTVCMNGTFIRRDVATTASTKTFHSVTSMHVEMACDMLQDSCLILSHSRALLPGTAVYPKNPGMVSQVYLVNGNHASHLNAKGKWVDSGDSQQIPIPDPLALGTGFCSESTRFIRVSDSMAQLHSWENTRMQFKTEGALATFHDAWQEIPRSYSTAISFDSSRGGMVREIVHVPDPRKPDLIRGEVEPVKIGEHWLPKRVTYTCGLSGVLFTWELDWVSVNEPIPEDLFDPETVLTMLGVAK